MSPETQKREVDQLGSSSQPGAEAATVHEPARDIPVLMERDVVVAGGGVAGLAAALGAARAGASVVLIESNAFLGGAATAGGMNHIGSYDPSVIRGVCSEVVERMEALGAAQTIYNSNLRSNSVVFDAEMYKYMSLSLLAEYGIDLLVLTVVSGPIVEEGRVAGLIVENKSGRSAVLGKVVVDATGDGDVAARAGAPFEVGRTIDGKTQAITLMFQVGDIDYETLIAYLETNRERFRELEIDTSRKQPQVIFGGFESELREAFENGELSYRHDILFVDGQMGAGASVNATHMIDFDGTDAISLSKAQTEGVKQVVETLAFLRKYAPGFGSATLRGISNRLGVRETRRIMGDYVLTEEDLATGRRFPDVIGRNSAPMDIHDPAGAAQTWIHVQAHDIPYRCLLPGEVEGLLTAGRCISVTHEALASVRFQPACMVTGQAAGVAAAIAARSGQMPRDLSVSQVQEVLRAQGAILE